MSWRRRASLGVLMLSMAGCGTLDPSVSSVRELTRPEIIRFSSLAAGDPLPAGWQPWTFGAFKKPTDYKLVAMEGRTVIRASASRSASGLIHPLRCSAREFPMLTWRWKVPELINGADNARQHAEDSPVRIVVAFEGDVSKLPALERITFNQFRMLTKNELPYATLMYIWENRAPRETILESPHTSRIRMLVAESGAARLGEWREETRDLYADFKRAFGEEPPPIKWIGIMTDTDNTGEDTSAYYGDIELVARSR